MSRSSHHRAAPARDRRLTIVAVGLTVIAALLLSPITSDAASGNENRRPRPSTTPTPTAAANAGLGADPAASGQASPSTTGTTDGRTDVTTDGTAASSGVTPSGDASPAPSGSPTGQPSASATTPATLEILGNTCDGSQLPPHDGFQNGNRCVSTQFGEVGNADTNPTLLITDAPRAVRANQPFTLRVSTRNLVRDRFLAAAKGGYYKESSFLNAQGLVRGHFHTSCRILAGRGAAPDPAPVPAFFVATEDRGGGATPDTVTVRVSGLPRGLAQCAVWAGDGSHRVPMMQRANQIPAFDAVRIQVR